MMKDLTEGNPQSLLWRFTIPMFISVIFQQLYNIADSVIAGRFAGEDALAAVGASYPITMIFMAIAVGSNIGCSVVISQFFGAKRYEQMKTSVYTTLISASVLSVVLTVFGLLGSRFLMRMIQTPENIFSLGDLYLRIYIGGFVFLFLYNVATGIFTSLGDSKTPLYFLIGSSLGNIFLDYWFVAGLHWGVAGVAWATFIAQGIACVLALITMVGRLKQIKTEKRAAYFSADMLKRIARIAVPSILQQSFVSIGGTDQFLWILRHCRIFRGHQAEYLYHHQFYDTWKRNFQFYSSEYRCRKGGPREGRNARGSKDGPSSCGSVYCGIFRFWPCHDVPVYAGGERGSHGNRYPVSADRISILCGDCVKAGL